MYSGFFICLLLGSMIAVVSSQDWMRDMLMMRMMMGGGGFGSSGGGYGSSGGGYGSSGPGYSSSGGVSPSRGGYNTVSATRPQPGGAKQPSYRVQSRPVHRAVSNSRSRMNPMFMIMALTGQMGDSARNMLMCSALGPWACMMKV